MDLTLIVHIMGGVSGLAIGYVALSAKKGAPLHRKAGMLFVYAMVTMATSGAFIAATRNVAPMVNIPAASLTAYLVITALTTVRPRGAISRRLDISALLVGLAVGVATMIGGVLAIAGGGTLNGAPAPVLFMFSAVALGASVGDVRMMRAGGLLGAPRLRRHLWRMCYALWIAAASFFLGGDRVPEPLRHPMLLAIPVLIPILAMPYWFWCLRARRASRATAGVTIPYPPVAEPAK